MVTLGTDTTSALTPLSQLTSSAEKLAEKTMATTADGDLEALAWASRWPERQWASKTAGT